MPTPIKLFNYELPTQLIALRPSKRRDECRLLTLDPTASTMRDAVFKDIISMISDDSFLVVNNTKVHNARLYGKKETGGLVEFFVVETISDYKCKAIVRGRLKAGAKIILPECEALLIEKDNDGVWTAETSNNIIDVMEKHGHVPLPPYIDRKDMESDKTDYQTIFSKERGSVAAPTAGLHFTPELLGALKAKGVPVIEVTLDVGIGTFRPVKTDTLEEHKMHSERYFISENVAADIERYKKEGRRLIAVGSTAVRTLESAAVSNYSVNSGEGRTELLISQGYAFKMVDAMITNFHLPESTLLAMVTAFGGYSFVMDAYRYAVEQKYRFFSYGDAMFIVGKSQ